MYQDIWSFLLKLCSLEPYIHTLYDQDGLFGSLDLSKSGFQTSGLHDPSLTQEFMGLSPVSKTKEVNTSCSNLYQGQGVEDGSLNNTYCVLVQWGQPLSCI